MPRGPLTYAALVLVLSAALFGAYRYWFYEEPRATGLLAEAMMAAVDPEESRQIFNGIVADHVDVTAPVIEQITIFENNGFDCAISPVEETSAQMLNCRRPVDGRRYCDLLRYFAYETAEGAIIESLAHSFTIPSGDRHLGRCSYRAPTSQE